MIRAVILDMDGTMIDTERAAALAWPQVGEAFGFEVTQTFINYMMDLTGNIRRERLREALSDRSDLDQILVYYHEKVRENLNENGIALKPGLTELIAYCQTRNLILAVASSSGMSRIEQILNEHGILHHFNLIISGDMVTHHKPDKEIYVLTATSLKLTNDECIVIEDSRVGLMAAFGANMKVILVPDVEVPDETMLNQCEACVASLSEAIVVIDKQLQNDRLWLLNNQ